jgi:hypothetical protein
MQANGHVLNDKSVALKMRANRRHSFHALGFMDSTIASPGGNTIATLRRVAQAGRTEGRYYWRGRGRPPSPRDHENQGGRQPGGRHAFG